MKKIQNVIFCCLLLVTFASRLSLSAQSPCPPQTGVVTSNPVFPGCQAPGGGPFRVLLILDESGSISPSTAMVEAAVRGFANILHTQTDANGKVEMGIVDFASSAANSFVIRDVKPNSFMTDIDNYLGANYSPAGGTDYFDALVAAQAIRDVDIIFFITDGNPTENSAVNTWLAEANKIKCSGVYIFGIGVGAETPGFNDNIQRLSGPDLLNSPKTLQEGADWTRESFASLGQALIDLASSLVDNQSPVLACPAPIKMVNNPGLCGASVIFNPTFSDNCPNVTISSVPPSGSFFPVGQTTVAVTARDNVGHTSTCSFRVTVIDLEAPAIICPVDKTISCEELSTPANTGTAAAVDNCAIASIQHEDVISPGACTHSFTIMRTWTAADNSGNIKTCLQAIKVEDKKPPVITCPANITVTCDTTVAKTGLATAVDNCDDRMDFSRFDTHISGDCEWFCITDRTWKAKDDCGNTSTCVQRITKDVTPLIEEALAGGALKYGQNAATVTIPPGRGACVVQWLPYAGTTPKTLPFDDAVAGADCRLMSNPINATGRLENPLLGETIKLSLLARLIPGFGARQLSSFGCTITPIIKQSLKPNPDVNELIRVTNLTLGNVNVNLSQPPHINQLLDLLKCINGKFTVCGPK
ncbi:MAG: HYR domain-containing protein [Saprospiraceae bacterium]|nr:HYR domain-containing protein [Saprospiraceae bacterium]